VPRPCAFNFPCLRLDADQAPGTNECQIPAARIQPEKATPIYLGSFPWLTCASVVLRVALAANRSSAYLGSPSLIFRWPRRRPTSRRRASGMMALTGIVFPCGLRHGAIQRDPPTRRGWFSGSPRDPRALSFALSVCSHVHLGAVTRLGRPGRIGTVRFFLRSLWRR